MPLYRLALPSIVTLILSTLSVISGGLTTPAQAANTFKVGWSPGNIVARSGPSPYLPQVGETIANNTSVSVSCEQAGRTVTNTANESTAIWERLTDGRWVPNAFVITGTASWTPGVPRCGYLRSAAASWARAHVRDAEKIAGNDCAWFASRALWSGGMPMDSTWFDDASVTSTVRADSLVRRVVALGRGKLTRVSWSDNSAGHAVVGDLIGYDWDGGGTIDHVAVVTSLTSSGYPRVTQHSPAQLDRYWSYSDVGQDWIEILYPRSVAYRLALSG